MAAGIALPEGDPALLPGIMFLSPAEAMVGEIGFLCGLSWEMVTDQPVTVGYQQFGCPQEHAWREGEHFSVGFCVKGK